MKHQRWAVEFPQDRQEVVAEISAHFSSFILVSLLEVHLFLWIQIARGGPAHKEDWFSFKIAQNIQLL